MCKATPLKSKAFNLRGLPEGGTSEDSMLMWNLTAALKQYPY